MQCFKKEGLILVLRRNLWTWIMQPSQPLHFSSPFPQDGPSPLHLAHTHLARLSLPPRNHTAWADFAQRAAPLCSPPVSSAFWVDGLAPSPCPPGAFISCYTPLHTHTHTRLMLTAWVCINERKTFRLEVRGKTLEAFWAMLLMSRWMWF